MEVANVDLLLAWFTDQVEAIHVKKNACLSFYFSFFNNVANYLRNMHSVIEVG